MSSTRNPVRAAGYGIVAGVIASVAMAMYAMIAAWEKGTGFFTPLHHIGSLWASPDALRASLKAAMGGSDFHLVLGTAVLGAVIHMMTGAMYGAVFGLVVAPLTLKPTGLVAAGIFYGALVLVVSAFIGLPVAAAIFGSGDQITHMATMAGWGAFIVEHLIFGLALGLQFAWQRRRARGAAMPRVATQAY